MVGLITQIKEKIPFDAFTATEISNLLEGSDHSRYGVIKRAVANGDLLKIRRGLYCFSKRHQRHKVNLYALAQRIYNPSYISLESALSFHGLIPEAVYTVTSVCQKRSAQFNTPLGAFSYISLPKFNFIGVERLLEEGEPYLMASPTKALADYVLAYKKDWKGIDPLVNSLRIEDERLHAISIDLMNELADAHKSRRLMRFIGGLRKDLGL